MDPEILRILRQMRSEIPNFKIYKRNFSIIYTGRFIINRDCLSRAEAWRTDFNRLWSVLFWKIWVDFFNFQQKQRMLHLISLVIGKIQRTTVRTGIFYILKIHYNPHDKPVSKMDQTSIYILFQFIISKIGLLPIQNYSTTTSSIYEIIWPFISKKLWSLCNNFNQLQS